MLMHPYLLERVHERQAEFRAEAAHQAIVDEAVRAKKITIVRRVQRPIRIVRTLRLAVRTEMPA